MNWLLCGAIATSSGQSDAYRARARPPSSIDRSIGGTGRGDRKETVWDAAAAHVELVGPDAGDLPEKNVHAAREEVADQHPRRNVEHDPDEAHEGPEARAQERRVPVGIHRRRRPRRRPQEPAVADRLSPAHRLNRKQEEAKRGRKGSPPSPRAPEPSAGAPRCAVKAALELQRGRARDEAAGPNVAQSTTTTFRTTRASFAFARSDSGGSDSAGLGGPLAKPPPRRQQRGRPQTQTAWLLPR